MTTTLETAAEVYAEATGTTAREVLEKMLADPEGPVARTVAMLMFAAA